MDVEKCLRGMTLAEKARLCVGMNFWMTQHYPEMGRPKPVFVGRPPWPAQTGHEQQRPFGNQ